jgi:hypothetical protein
MMLQMYGFKDYNFSKLSFLYFVLYTLYKKKKYQSL